MGFSLLLFSLLAGVALIQGHPGEELRSLSEREFVYKRDVAILQQHRAQRCQPVVTVQHAERRRKRSLLSQAPIAINASAHLSASGTHSADKPHFTEIQNFTCITTPEVEEGPYFIHNEFIRQDLREKQLGVPLVLDIGVLDIDTCEPLKDVFVEIWSCNATGFYSGFTHVNAKLPPARHSSNSKHDILQPFGPPMTDQLSWLRGGYPTNAEGLAEFTTVYPGFYHGRTIHAHVIIHQNWKANHNGTVDSHAGEVRHIGQLFFEEDWNDAVLNTKHYFNNTQKRVYNEQDLDFILANSGGYNAFVSLEKLGDSLGDGLLGYITIGVDTTLDLPISSNNYATELDEHITNLN